MKTIAYNPSTIEVEFANAIMRMREDIQKQLSNNEIIDIQHRIQDDNPSLKFILLDKDGDPHEVVIKVIQTPDKF
jgi:hypothetical protein